MLSSPRSMFMSDCPSCRCRHSLHFCRPRTGLIRPGRTTSVQDSHPAEAAAAGCICRRRRLHLLALTVAEREPGIPGDASTSLGIPRRQRADVA
jgi:hypothetical protein